MAIRPGAAKSQNGSSCRNKSGRNRQTATGIRCRSISCRVFPRWTRLSSRAFLRVFLTEFWNYACRGNA